jgi:hypothetical protein
MAATVGFGAVIYDKAWCGLVWQLWYGFVRLSMIGRGVVWYGSYGKIYIISN